MSAKRTAPSVCVSLEDSECQTKRFCVDGIDAIFTEFPENMKKQIALHLHDLCDIHRGPDVNSLRFCNSNAADVNGGVPFSAAYCSVKLVKRKVFGTIFAHGLTMISSFLDEGKLPDDVAERYVLGKLLHYLVDVEKQVALLNLEQYDKTDLAIVLANHLFGRLATSSRYVVDKNCTQKNCTQKNIGKRSKCPCSSDCDMSGTLGDTSIGNEEVWHGNLDIIINQDVGVNIIENDDTDPESSREKSSFRGKINTCYMENCHQTIAQTVVFSFLQKQIHPLSKHFVVPCFGVTSTSLVIYFYDSEHDVLLESTPMSMLASTKNESHMKVNLTTILASWLAVNYKYLSSGLPQSLKSEHRKADFFSQAGGKIEVYRNNLKSGDVGKAVCPPVDSEDSVDYLSDDLNDIRCSLYEVIWRGKKGKSAIQRTVKS